MAEQQLEWGNTSVGFNKSLLYQTGPQICTIRAFEMQDYFEKGKTLHIAFNIPDNDDFGHMTKPMKKALKDMFPEKSPEALIGFTVMVQSQATEAKGEYSAGHQVIISAPPTPQSTEPAAPAPKEVAF